MIRSSIGELPVSLADMPVTEWAAAVVLRHSARTYTGRAVGPALLDRLERFCGCLPAADVARVVLVRDAPGSVFTGFVGSYGRVLGAPSALLMIGMEAEPAVQESLGYLGEAAILEATSLGLGTCWVGGFFDRPLAAALVALAPGERVLAISPVGEAQARPRAGARVLKRFVGAHKRKAADAIAPGFDAELWPAWAAEGVRLARVAPSAVNRQAWRFELEPAPAAGAGGAQGPVAAAGPTGAVIVSTVTKGNEGNVSRRLDCGIAMLHFEVGARLMGAPGRWEVLDAPDVARYRVTATVGE
ncbi:MAG: nitroreductase family protein [bacterium]